MALPVPSSPHLRSPGDSRSTGCWRHLREISVRSDHVPGLQAQSLGVRAGTGGGLRSNDRRGQQSHAVRTESGVLGTPRQTMAAGRRISRPFLLGSPSGREGSEHKPGDSEILGRRDPYSPAASRPKGGTGRRVLRGEDSLWPLAAWALPPQLWPLGESASSPARCEERGRAGPRLDPRRPASARSPHLRPQPRTRCSAAPQPPPPRFPSSPGVRPVSSRETAARSHRLAPAWLPASPRIPELQPETRSWAPAAVR